MQGERTDSGSEKHRQRELGSNVGHRAERVLCGRRRLPHTGLDEWRIKAGLQPSREERGMHY